MCAAFADNGHEVTLVAPRARDRSADDLGNVHEFYGVEASFRIHRIPWRSVPGKSLLFGYRCGRYAKRSGFDVAYGRFVHGCAFAALFGVEVIYEAHLPMSAWSPLERASFAAMSRLPTFKRLVVISEALKDSYAKANAVADERVLLAPDGADPADHVGAPAALLHRPDRLQVGYVGQLYPGKGMELIATIAPRCRWADFHIVGGEPDDVAKWKLALAQADNVHFHGFVPPAELHRYRDAVDVNVAPYLRRVFGAGNGAEISRWMSPLKIFEYMASGRAIVCSDLPALREVLEEGQTALFCDPDRPSTWCAALERLRDDPELRSELGRNARALLERSYTWKQRAARILESLATPEITARSREPSP
jgi:glycosyltransferase involved in cell wall biosynthesis